MSLFLCWDLRKETGSGLFRVTHRVPLSEPSGRVREERGVNMGSSSSSYAPKTIYLDVDGRVQKVSPSFSTSFVYVYTFFLGILNLHMNTLQWQ